MLDPATLAALREAEGKATPGPWCDCSARDGNCSCSVIYGPEGPVAFAACETDANAVDWCTRVDAETKQANKDLIALSRNALPALLDMADECVRLRSERYSYRIGRDIDRADIARLEAHIARETQGPDPDAPGPAFERWRCRAHTADVECVRLREEVHALRLQLTRYTNPDPHDVWR